MLGKIKVKMKKRKCCKTEPNAQFIVIAVFLRNIELKLKIKCSSLFKLLFIRFNKQINKKENEKNVHCCLY